MKLEQTSEVDPTRIGRIPSAGAALIGTTSIDIRCFDHIDRISLDTSRIEHIDTACAALTQARAILDLLNPTSLDGPGAGSLWAARDAIQRAHDAVRSIKP